MAILTISREYGSGGREIGRAVAAALGYRYEDRRTVLAGLRETHPRWERWGEEYDEHRPSLWERCDWSFRGYVALMQRILLEAAARDRVVIVGRGGNFLLAGVPTALRIRIVASHAARIERIMEREPLDRDNVRRLIWRTDRDRAGFIRAVYRRDWQDPAAFDRNYDTGLLDHGMIAKEVTGLLEQCDRIDRDEIRCSIARRVAAARVRAGLFTDPGVQLPVLEVLEEGERLLVRGVVHRPEEKTRVVSAASALAGDVPLAFDLRYR